MISITKKSHISAIIISLALFFSIIPARAQNRIDSTNITYQSAFFENIAPTNALEMVNRIPGFKIDTADERRGLGQGGANILLNGERLTGKTNPSDQLSRIPAANVIRIVMLDGASLDIPGLSGQVANIIFTTSQLTGTWLWRPEFRSKLDPDWLHGEASVSGKSGDLGYTVTVRNNSFRQGNRGPESLIDANDVLFETRYEDRRSSGDRPGVKINLTHTSIDGHIANLNAGFNLYDLERRETSIRSAITDAGQNLESLYTQSTDEKVGDISGDYEYPMAAGKLKLIGLYQHKHTPTVHNLENLNETETVYISQFTQSSDKIEAILRAEYSWVSRENHDWQIGMEGAFNSLDIESQFREGSTSGLFTRMGPIDTSKVEEDRAEITITHSRRLSPEWDVQASLGGEYSKLTQSSFDDFNILTDENSRDFVRAKGFVAATFKPDTNTSIRGKIERKVGQLNFFDFISSVSLEEDLYQTGNPDLVPEQSWVGEVELDKNLGDGNTIRIRGYGELISDIVDRIPIGDDGDAIGNIDSAHRYGIVLSSTLKGEKWGMDGTQLDIELELRNSSVNDPLLNFSRRLNQDKKLGYSIDFRHDIPNTDLAYGAYVGENIRSWVYRITTEERQTYTKPVVMAFVEHKNVAGMKVKISAYNLLDQGNKFERRIFNNRRDIGELEWVESRVRTYDPFVRLDISGTF